MPAISLEEKFAAFSDQWSPKIIAPLNDYQVKLVKVQGSFPWHKHEDTDELFLVTKGQLVIDMKEGAVTLGAGELYVVPKGVDHAPRAEQECEMLLIEPAGTINTGDAKEPGTAGEWI